MTQLDMGNTNNVIVIIIDALRADRVNPLNTDRTSLTPNIDEIAANGSVFEDAYTTASNTDPAVTALLSGRYPLNSVLHHGKIVTDDEKEQIESIPTLPSMLRDHGIQTVAHGQPLGRWHSQGFDHYPDPTGQNESLLLDTARGIYDTLSLVAPRLASAIRSVYTSVSVDNDKAPDIVMQDYDPTALLDHVDNGSFFGVLHLMETHMPYLARTEDFEAVTTVYNYPGESLDEFFEDKDVTQEQYDRVANAQENLGVESPGELIALYDASVRYADWKVGQLVDALRDIDKWEDTALFITSDHGESLLDNGIYFDHHGLYDNVMQVPLVTNLPNERDGISEFVQHIDLAPTIMDLFDVEQPPVDGQSLLPLLRREPDDWRDAVFAEEAYTERRIGIRTNKWKFVKHVADNPIESERGSSLQCGYCNTVHGSERMLFNVKQEPENRENVIDEHPDVINNLEAKYQEFVSDLISPSTSEGDIRYENEEEVMERLEAIGYK